MGNPEEAGFGKEAAGADHHDDAPPAYSETPGAPSAAAAAAPPPPPTFHESHPAAEKAAPSPSALETPPSPSLSSATNDNSLTAAPSSYPTKFPPALNGYYQWKVTRTFFLGTARDRPLYAVKVHTGLTSKPEVELFDGPSSEDADKGGSPLLATARHDGPNDGSGTLVTLPPAPGSDFPTASERMRAEWGLGAKHVCHRFSIEVGKGAGSRREDFEWRPSRGSEVQDLAGKRNPGWKLVRLANRIGEGSSEEGGSGGGDDETSSNAESSSTSQKKQKGKQKEERRTPGVTSDGREVVAVWALNTMPLTMTKALKLEFRGSAARGELGERWEIMAVVTALRLWYLVWQGRALAPSTNH